MRPAAHNPSPSAPPVQSNTNYSGPPVQMPQPFGSGIGFMPHITQTSHMNPQMGYQAPLTRLPSMGYSSPPQNVSPYPNYTQPTVQYQNYAQNYQLPQANFPQHTQATQNCHYSQQPPPHVYPNLNNSAPFSYTPPNPRTPRSTSDYMRKVIVGKL